MNSDPGDDRSLTVGVYDEPELVVSGVDQMLGRTGSPVRVVPVPADTETTDVDVLLCDPIGRPVQLEDYLDRVVALSQAPVLVFTWSSSAANQRRSLAAGARGFVSKELSAEQLADAVAAVHRGETVAAAPRSAPLDSGRAELSARESEVLELICRGMSNLEIADQLFVSVNSVKTYVRQIYQKIGVARRSQAVAWGLARGF